MKAIISTTTDAKYSFYAPLAAWSWLQMGVTPVIMVWKERIAPMPPATALAIRIAIDMGATVEYFYAPEDRCPTYAQVSRLFGWLFAEQDEQVITSDVDMMVFDATFWRGFDPEKVHSVGWDLSPNNQYPMCYCIATRKQWRSLLNFSWSDIPRQHRPSIRKTIKAACDPYIAHEQSQHFRSDFWCRDQEILFAGLNSLKTTEVNFHARARGPEQPWATRRYDRAGWGQWDINDIVDAHLPRKEEHADYFTKILELCNNKYPFQSFKWLEDYHKEFENLV